MITYPALGRKPADTADYLSCLSNVFNTDDVPVGFFDLLGDALSLELTPEETLAYVRLGLHILYRAGGRPVVPARDNVHLWEVTDRYGTTEDAIVENMIADWLAAGRMPEWGEWALATPRILDKIKPDWMK